MIESRERVAELTPTSRALSGASAARAAAAGLRRAPGVAAARAAHRVAPVLEWLDRQLLDAYARDFPVCELPYAAMARRFHCRTSEVLRRLAGLERRGVVSRIGPVFAPGRVDASTLVAMAVPGARLESIAEWVRRHQAVSHVDEREHEFNLWFVLAAANAGALYEAVADIRRRTGLDVLDLRPERDYHVDTGIPPRRGSPSGRRPAAAHRGSPARCPPLDASDRRLVEAIGDGLPLTARPYAAVADRTGLSEAQVMERLRRLLYEGVIERMGVIVHPRELGYGASAMVAFDMPCARVDGVGERLARSEQITECCRRTRRAPMWPFNLHCMLHGRDRAHVMAQVNALLHETDRGVRRSVLFDRRRLGEHAAHCAPDHPPPPAGAARSAAAPEAADRVEGESRCAQRDTARSMERRGRSGAARAPAISPAHNGGAHRGRSRHRPGSRHGWQPRCSGFPAWLCPPGRSTPPASTARGSTSRRRDAGAGIRRRESRGRMGRRGSCESVRGATPVKGALRDSRTSTQSDG